MRRLADENIEGDFTAGSDGVFSDIFEVIPGNAPQMLWHLQASNPNAYRGFYAANLQTSVQW